MKTMKVLNQMVADLNQMLMLSYQVHWYMRGEGFLVLHPLLDSYIKEYQSYIDQAAEELIILGGNPYSTLKELADHTNLHIESGDYQLSIHEQLKKLLQGLQYLNQELDKGIKVAEEEDLLSVVDLFIKMKAETEKHIWMLRAELKE